MNTYWLAALFLIALLVRLPFLPFNPLSADPLTVTGDFSMDGYYPLAENLRAGNGYSILGEPYPPADIRTPGYPFFLVAAVSLFGSYKAVFVMQIVLGSLAALLAFLLAREFLSVLWTRLVGLAVALEPLGAYLSGVILTETLFTFLFLLTLLLFVRFLKTHRFLYLAASSFLLGISTLVKPTVEYMPVLILFLVFLTYGATLSRRFVLHGAAACLIFLAVLSPWIYRNYQTFGHAALSIQPVSNLYTCLVPSAIALDTHIPFTQAQREFLEYGGLKGVEDITLANAGVYRALALQEMLRHPVGLIKSFGTTLYAFFFNDGYRAIVDRYFSLQSPFALAFIGIGRLVWIGVTLAALWGAYRHYRTHGITPALVLLVGVTAYFLATTAVIGLAVNGRFRLPINTLLFILAAYALAPIVDSVRASIARLRRP